MNIVQRTLATDLVATLVISIGRRKRLVLVSLAARWSVAEARLWEDATSNMLAASPVITQVTGPVSKLETRDHEGEAIGMLLDRLPEACPSATSLVSFTREPPTRSLFAGSPRSTTSRHSPRSWRMSTARLRSSMTS